MTVYLLGAGPGDPGLMTLKGAEVLRQADVVVYDRLAQFPGSVLNLTQPAAQKIYVGKTPNGPRYQQEEINQLLIELAQKNEVVVRLKGGDPFVFARGGEEAEALISAGVDFEIIPGISSPIAVPAYAGIPVTLRHSSTSFTVITGHEDPTTDKSVDWSAVAKLGGTLIILMGAQRWDDISEELQKAGMDPSTPVAAIRWGTRPTQTTIRSTLAKLGDHDLQAPLTIVVGSVAQKELSWFESLPLFGKRILVTRAASQASALSQKLFKLGAEAVEVPLIEIVAPKDEGASLKQALSELTVGDWVVCTSPNGVRHLFEHIPDSRFLGGLNIAAIGPATAQAFKSRNLHPDLVPETYVAEALLEAFPDPVRMSQKVLLARAAKAREVLPDGLRKKGYEVLVCEAYQTLFTQPEAEELEAIKTCDIVVFASPSSIESYLSLGLGAPKAAACIGPITAAAAKSAGFDPLIVAEEYTLDGLIDAIKS